MYTLLCCADLYGDKINLELTFPNMPTISELQRKIVETFNGEAAVKRPSGYPNIEFHIARIQIYDDVLLKWADLVTCTQLHEYDQLYIFQPQSPWHIDVQKDLPPPRPPSQLMPSGSVNNSLAYGNNNNNNSYSSVNRSQQQQPQSHYSAGNNNNSRGGNGDSPARDRLLQAKQREEQMRAELARVHEETMRLEEEARREEEMAARRGASDQEEMLRRKEMEIERQRAALMQAEEEYRRARAGGGNPSYR